MSEFDHYSKVRLCGVCGKPTLPRNSLHLFCDTCRNLLIGDLNPNAWSKEVTKDYSKEGTNARSKETTTLTPVGERLMEFIDTLSIIARKVVEIQENEAH